MANFKIWHQKKYCSCKSKLKFYPERIHRPEQIGDRLIHAHHTKWEVGRAIKDIQFKVLKDLKKGQNIFPTVRVGGAFPPKEDLKWTLPEGKDLNTELKKSEFQKE